MENDHQLYLRFLQGDSASYDELLIRYGDSLTVYLNGVISPESVRRACDLKLVLQEASAHSAGNGAFI